MSIKGRWQRLVSRKSLSSAHSSADSSSSSDPCDQPPLPSSSGTSTPSTIPISTPPCVPIPNPSSQISTSLSKTTTTGSSLLSKTLTWRSSHGAGTSPSRAEKRSERKEKRAAATQTPRRKLHPSERPLTEANLRQQEMLSAFKWEFGRSGRRGSLGGWSVESGISPCCSRRGSLVAPPSA